MDAGDGVDSVVVDVGDGSSAVGVGFEGLEF